MWEITGMFFNIKVWVELCFLDGKSRPLALHNLNQTSYITKSKDLCHGSVMKYFYIWQYNPQEMASATESNCRNERRGCSFLCLVSSRRVQMHSCWTFTVSDLSRVVVFQTFKNATQQLSIRERPAWEHLGVNCWEHSNKDHLSPNKRGEYDER